MVTQIVKTQKLQLLRPLSDTTSARSGDDFALRRLEHFTPHTRACLQTIFSSPQKRVLSRTLSTLQTSPSSRYVSYVHLDGQDVAA